MKTYKFKISCTSIDDLCYNNNKISEKNYNKLEELINNYNYININIYNLLILYKKLKRKNITTKTLEFICDYKITEIDFQTFIQNMIDIGFNSKRDTNIEFIDNDKPNEPIYIYKFQSITKIETKKSTYCILYIFL